MSEIDVFSKYVGLEWRYPQNDCVALVKRVAENEFGYTFSHASLPTESDAAFNVAAFMQARDSAEWILQDGPQPGFMALFWYLGKPIHVGICLRDDYILHCHGNLRRAGKSKIERLCKFPKYWQRVEFYRNANHNL